MRLPMKPGSLKRKSGPRTEPWGTSKLRGWGMRRRKQKKVGGWGHNLFMRAGGKAECAA